ncbi:MAG: septal ring lytic transglycosylase RlpA family protein [Gammaproteobacteria bacterium]
MTRAAVFLAAFVLVILTGCQPAKVATSGPATLPPVATPTGGSSNANKTNPYVVLGKRYVPLLSAEGYHERGVASWYGPQFHGKPTANGEVFDMDQMTAAHKTLPLPVYAEVTNLRNGRKVVVRINDRGPFVDNRLIDLSRAAAQAIDMVGPGTSLVDVRVIQGPGGGPSGGPAPTVQPAIVSAPVVAPTGAFFIQVGAYGDADNANRVVNSLRSSGFGDTLVQPIQLNQRILHRVRVGPVASVEQFDQYIERLNALGYARARLAVD